MSMVDPRVFRNYDIRALVPELVDETSEYFGKVGSADAYQAPLTPEGVEEIGRGLAVFFNQPEVAIGYDARISGPAWAAALTRGFCREGVNVLNIGQSTTDMVYYASGKYNMPGVMITASHSPKELNGMKLVHPGAQVIGMGSGMEELRDLVIADNFRTPGKSGTERSKDLLHEYIDHIMQFLPKPEEIKSFKIVADAGNGVGGIPSHKIFERLPQLSVTELFFNPDGTFPNHGPNPFERENIELLVEEVQKTGADFGVAWDGDADRVFFVDELGNPISGDFITTLVARHFLNMYPGSSIVYDLRASRSVKDWVSKLGGIAISERVGHSYIKKTMRATDAVFGGEVSGHYYFRDHFYADNGFIPLLAILQMLSETGMKMSELVASLGSYYISGEINSTVASTQAVIDRIKSTFSDAELDYRDGITVEYPDWHFNVRPSANDPLVRLNLEAESQIEMETKRDELLNLIRL